MSQNCIFCKIVAGEIPCSKVYEDDQVLAFLDINPVTSGHTLLIPKAHHPMLDDTPDDLLGYIFAQVKSLMGAIRQGLKADFVVISVVGTEVPHLHIHLIPRNHNDGLEKFWPTKKYQAGEDQLVLEKIKNSL